MIRCMLAVPIAIVVAIWPSQAAALERLCDPAHEDCRAPLIALIDAEQHGVDVAFWFMEDTRYASALIRAHRRGVRVRVLMDTRVNSGSPLNVVTLQMLEDAGIPMREKVSSGILHWKMMHFAGQQTVQFSGGNYSAEAFVPITPYSNYVDEVIYFTDKPSYVNSFMTKFEDVWTAGPDKGFENYANVTTPSRAYPSHPIDPELNFPPGGFRSRTRAAFRAETSRIDAIMYRITDRAYTDVLIEVAASGIPVRLITEPHQYRDESRLWHAWNVDRLYAAGRRQQINGQPAIHIRHRRHAGLNHEKLVVLRGQTMSIFGSSNWTSPSNDSQLEHNLFTKDLVIFEWTRTHFDRKWFNTGPAQETQPFLPLPPGVPQLLSPANGKTNLSTTGTSLQWNGGPWAHRYDVYFGTNPSSLPKVVNDQEMGPYVQAWSPPDVLSPGTVYYWRVVGRTMAGLERSSLTCSFKTAGGSNGSQPSSSCSASPPTAPDPPSTNDPQDMGPPPGPELPPTTPEPEPGGNNGGSGNVVPPTSNPGVDPSDFPNVPDRSPTEHGTYTGTTAIPREE